MGMGLEEESAAAFGVQNLPHAPPGTLRGEQRGTAELQIVLIFQPGESEDKLEN